MAFGFSEYLLTLNVAGLVIPASGVYVRLVNADTAQEYITAARTDAGGYYIAPAGISPGIYATSFKVNLGDPAWTPTGNTVLAVPFVDLQVALIGNGTDEGPSINAAMLAASTRGGGRVRLVGGKTASFSTQLLFKNDVVLDLAGSTLKWTGAVGGTMFTSAAADPLLRSGIIGGRVDPQATFTGIVFDCHSPQYCKFDVEVLAGSATCTIKRWAADAVNSTGYDGTRNAVFNTVDRLLAATCGTYMRLTGQATGAVTLNKFGFLQALDVRVAALVCSAAGYVDTNTVDHFRCQLKANNAIGVDLGENNASTNIYGWTFTHLAVDDLGGFTGCKGMALRNSQKTIAVAYYHANFPGGGTALDVGIAGSYYICDTFDSGGPGMRVTSKGWAQDAAVAGDNTWNNPYLVSALLFKPVLSDVVAGTPRLLRVNTGVVEARNTADGAYAPIRGIFMPVSDALASQAGQVFQGSGVPNNANGNNGDVYFRTDTPGTVNQRIYVRSAGAWVGIV